MSDSMPVISLIIPVYKTERYLRRCLDSVVCQPEFLSGKVEVVVVNDCSPDGSRAIGEEYAHRCKNLSLVDLPENQGVAAARNVGIDRARGRYLMFLDSDDALEQCAFSKILSVIREFAPDFIKFLHTRMTDDGKVLFVKTSTATGLQDVSRGLISTCENVFENIILNMMGWNGVYSRDVVGRMRFSSDFPISEDSFFALQCACAAQRFYLLNEPLLRYYQRDESLTHNVSRKAAVGLIELISRYWIVCEKVEWLKPLYPWLVRRLTFFMLGWLRELVLVEKAGDKELRLAYFRALGELCGRKGAVRGLGVLLPFLRLASVCKSGYLLIVAKTYTRIVQAVCRHACHALRIPRTEHFAMV